jgi:hypothetical protein
MDEVSATAIANVTVMAAREEMNWLNIDKALSMLSRMACRRRLAMRGREGL